MLSAGGSLLIRSPWASSSCTTMKARAAASWQPSSKATSTRSTAMPRSCASATTMRSYSERGVPADGGAIVAAVSAAAAAGAAPWEIWSRRCITAEASTSSVSPPSTRSTISCSVSRQAKSASVIAGVTGAPSSRMAARTSSMRWVSRAMASKPIVALIPLRECATRKMTVSGSESPGSRSRSRREAFSACRLSRLSSRKRPRYSDVSTPWFSSRMSIPDPPREPARCPVRRTRHPVLLPHRYRPGGGWL